MANREGICKAAFFTHKYLGELGPQELASHDPRAMLSRDGRSFSGLFWDYTTPDQQESNRPFFRKLRPAQPVAPVELQVSHLKSGTHRLRMFRTGFKADDAYSQYIEWGMPKDLSADRIATINKLSADRPEAERTVNVGRDGTFRRPSICAPMMWFC